MLKNELKIKCDTETGGLDPAIHSILEVGLTCEIDGKVFQYVSRVAEANITVTPYALKVNGLDPFADDWDGKPCYAVAKELQAYFCGVEDAAEAAGLQIFCVFQNPTFDVGFIRRLFRLADVKIPKWLTGYHSLDTYTIGWLAAKVGLIENFGRLGQLLKEVGLDMADYDAHTSIGDCRATGDFLDEIERRAEAVRVKK